MIVVYVILNYMNCFPIILSEKM